MENRGSRQILSIVCCAVLLAMPYLLNAQTDRGAITGTVVDQSGAAVPGVTVTATRRETVTKSETTTTATGNYTFPSLEAGTYDLTFSANGFATSDADGIVVQTVQTARVDAKLQVGTSSQTVTVTSQGPMLQTESAQITETVAQNKIENLPLSNTNSGLENPIAFASTQPGVTATINGNLQLRVNGLPDDTYRTIVDGQDITSGIDPTHLSETNPSVEALQESTLQVSNFAAEFGQVAGGLLNYTTKSGSNDFHGSAWENWVNEIMNAGKPFTNNGNGGLLRPRDRSNGYGFNVGGPVLIPKLYNGRNKTFFFFNWEFYGSTTSLAGDFATVPTAAYRTGNFSGALTGKQLGTDPLGRPIMENEIYDPLTTRTVNGQIVRDPFPGDIVPQSRIDPVAAKIQALMPNPVGSAAVNNYPAEGLLSDFRSIPSVRIDQNLGLNTKLNFYWGEWRDDLPNNGASYLPFPISIARTYKTRVNTYRLNLDRTLTPTMLLHFGLGEMRYIHRDSAPNSVLDYNAQANLGLVGASRNPGPFPELTGIFAATGGGIAATGSSTGTIGLSNAGTYTNDNPTVVGSLSWVRGNHSLKTGGEWRETLWTDLEQVGTGGVYNLASQETGLPYLQLSSLNGGDVGFPYASFFLGAVDSASVSSGQEPNFRKYSYGLYVQDTWKVTPKFTLDYGIRYDYQQSWSESRDRWSEFGPNVPNPSAGGLLGGMQYQGYGAKRCNCEFSNTYPYAFGPRFGFAYAIDPKTVVRGGWGFTYGSTPGMQYLSGTAIVGTGWNTIPFTPSSFGIAPVSLSQGLQYPASELTNASLSPGIYPYPGQVNSPSYYVSPQAGRPARVNQWNITLQRQLTSDISIEAAYVGNRGVWLQSNLLDPNAATAGGFAAHGLNIANPANQALLLSPMNSPQVIAAGFKAPYVGFPTTLTLAQALRPYPQFTSITGEWAPTGNSWYDALQLRLIKRLSHGLDVSAGYVFQREESLGAVPGTGFGSAYELELTNDVYNRAANKSISPESQPQIFNTAITYQSPGFGDNKFIRMATKDWTYGAFLRYASGFPMASPYAQNGLNSLLLRKLTNGTGTFFNRVPGQPLFLKNLNCHCINPFQQLVLNPQAWSDPAPGQFSTGSIYYNDYRYQRRPQESMSLGRLFAVREGMTLEIRMQFFDVFNRTEQGDPNGTNALQTPSSANGALQSGFGYINPASLFGPARQGILSARFRF